MKALVVVVEGLQLGYVGCYGNDWISTPALDRLASEGVVFDQHFADRPDAAGAHDAWRTGRFNFTPSNSKDAHPSPTCADVISLLRTADVWTSLVLDESRAGPAFVKDWDEVCVVPAASGECTLEPLLDAVGHVLDRLATREDWLLWTHVSALLPPWIVPDSFWEDCMDESEEDGDELVQPWAGPLPEGVPAEDELMYSRLQETYAAAVRFVDAGLEVIVEAIQSRRLLDSLWLVVTTDHGLPLGEHGLAGEVATGLHEELVHLPLLMRLSGGEQAGRRVPALTQSVDLMPTLLEFFGVPPPSVHGHSLWPLIRGKKTEVRDYVCSFLPCGEEIRWLLRTGDWSLHVGARADEPLAPRLYIKPDDRWEVNDLCQHHQELAEQLEQTLRAFVAATQQPGPFQAPELIEVGVVDSDSSPEENST